MHVRIQRLLDGLVFFSKKDLACTRSGNFNQIYKKIEENWDLIYDHDLVPAYFFTKI